MFIISLGFNSEIMPIVWRRYTQLERVRQLKNEGREFIGREVIGTVKRDGENVSIYYDAETDTFPVGSHNLKDASEDIIARFKSTAEYPRICDYLKTEKTQYNGDYIAYGELLKQIGPTRIEPKRKYIHWVLFDLWNEFAQRFEPYNMVYQKGYDFKIPVVEAISTFKPFTLESIQNQIQADLKWCRRHRREGVVYKVYEGDNQTFAKEKIDLPDRPKIPQNPGKILYPLMDDETLFRALKHAQDELGPEDWKDKAKAMPLFAKMVSVEGAEHNFEPRKDLFKYYLDSLAPKLEPDITSEASGESSQHGIFSTTDTSN